MNKLRGSKIALFLLIFYAVFAVGIDFHSHGNAKDTYQHCKLCQVSTAWVVLTAAVIIVSQTAPLAVCPADDFNPLPASYVLLHSQQRPPPSA